MQVSVLFVSLNYMCLWCHCSADRQRKLCFSSLVPHPHSPQFPCLEPAAAAWPQTFLQTLTLCSHLLFLLLCHVSHPPLPPFHSWPSSVSHHTTFPLSAFATDPLSAQLFISSRLRTKEEGGLPCNCWESPVPTYIMSHRLRRQAGPPTLEGVWHVNRSALEGLIVKQSMTRLDAVEVEEPSSQRGGAGWNPSQVKHWRCKAREAGL